MRPTGWKMRYGSIALALAFLALVPGGVSAPKPRPHRHYLGFDRNDYPGDARMKDLRKMFSFTGYWLNSPVGAPDTKWKGKRKFLRSLGYGFLVLFRGRPYSGLKDQDAEKLGNEDALAAIAAAQEEGFPAGTILFIDQDEGGRLLEPQRFYLHAWIDRVNQSRFRAGVYCSGVVVQEPSGKSITTAADIREHAGKRKVEYWVANDACPPSPGCVIPRRPPAPEESEVAFASVWQFALSPKRMPISAACVGGYLSDENCYPPGIDAFIDINSANSPDPSHGRRRSSQPKP